MKPKTNSRKLINQVADHRLHQFTKEHGNKHCLFYLFQRGESMSLEVYFKSPQGKQFTELFYLVTIYHTFKAING